MQNGEAFLFGQPRVLSPYKIVFLLCDLLSVTKTNCIASMRIYLTILRCLPSLKTSFMHRLLINKLCLE